MSTELALSARGVWKAYGDVAVLKGVDFELREGQVGCLIGPSGAGKSSFLRCVNQLERADAGEIRLYGERIGFREQGGKLYETSEREVNKQRLGIGMVFQNFNLWKHRTALQNVADVPIRVYGISREESVSRAEELLERVGLREKAGRYPNQLSGGEQQRVAIARALAIQPRLMLFDEPTSALDPELVGEVLAVMRGLAESGMTMLVVTHEIGFARQVADVIGFMDQGQMIELGSRDEVLNGARQIRTRDFLAKVLA